MTWLDAHSGGMIAILTAVLAIVTTLYVIYTKKMVEQMAKQRSEISRQRIDSALPVIVLGWERSERLNAVVLTLSNEGSGTALHVNVRHRELPTLTSQFSSGTSYVPALRPGGTFPLTAYGIPENHEYTIAVSYTDVYGHRFVTCQSIRYLGGAYATLIRPDPGGSTFKARVAELDEAESKAAEAGGAEERGRTAESRRIDEEDEFEASGPYY